MAASEFSRGTAQGMAHRDNWDPQTLEQIKASSTYKGGTSMCYFGGAQRPAGETIIAQGGTLWSRRCSKCSETPGKIIIPAEGGETTQRRSFQHGARSG
ncbi:Testis-Expressed Protein 19 [Manis pentadactyla]|nr:Testis-Expressed Protein 19 [Manis pentadactyla]